MSKIKAFINRHKRALAVSAVSASLMVTSAVSAFAADPTTSPDIKSELQSQFSVIQGDLLGYAFMTIGIAVPVIAAFFGIRKCVSFFMKLTRKD